MKNPKTFKSNHWKQFFDLIKDESKTLTLLREIILDKIASKFLISNLVTKEILSTKKISSEWDSGMIGCLIYYLVYQESKTSKTGYIKGRKLRYYVIV